jgi:hypothetical protein
MVRRCKFKQNTIMNIFSYKKFSTFHFSKVLAKKGRLKLTLTKICGTPQRPIRGEQVLRSDGQAIVARLGKLGDLLS